MDFTNQTTDQKISYLFGLFAQHGHNEYIGEPVTVLEHSLQSAQLAVDAHETPIVVLAALFHDIGHLLPMHESEDMAGNGHLRHETVGAELLDNIGFPSNMGLLVRNHVQAKRYLTYKHPQYFEQLSEASKITLSFQGGIMTAQEAELFEKHPLFKKSLQLRAWDELAKETNKEVLPINYYYPMAHELFI